MVVIAVVGGSSTSVQICIDQKLETYALHGLCGKRGVEALDRGRGGRKERDVERGQEMGLVARRPWRNHLGLSKIF